jgi:hypothetical protein
MIRPFARLALSLAFAPLLALAACSPTKVVTAPVQAAGQAAGTVVRTTAPVVTGTAVGVATANPAAGMAAGRATQGAIARPAEASPAVEAAPEAEPPK